MFYTIRQEQVFQIPEEHADMSISLCLPFFFLFKQLGLYH